jgi:hypothetical protein
MNNTLYYILIVISVLIGLKILGGLFLYFFKLILEFYYRMKRKMTYTKEEYIESKKWEKTMKKRKK